MSGAFHMDGVDIATLGAVAVVGGEAYPLTGAFDLPKRTGETERNWGTGIETFVDREDIELDGRTLTLTALVGGSTYGGYEENLAALTAACVACKTLGSPLGDFRVIQKDDIGVTEHPGHDLALVTAKFYEEAVAIPPLTAVPSGGDGLLLDGFNLLGDLGIGVSEVKDSRNPGKRIEVSTTSTYRRTEYRDRTTLTLKCWMRGADLSDLYAKMGRFHALCSRPGLRELTLSGEPVARVYIKDGITARVDYVTALSFDLKLRVV